MHFSSTDAVLPPDYTFTEAVAGDVTFTGLVTFSAPGNQVVTVTLVGQPVMRGDSHDVRVFASVVTHLQVDASGGSNTAGRPIGIRVRARSDRGDVVPGYRGTVHFTSTDPAATLPPDFTFTAADNGDHFFLDRLAGEDGAGFFFLVLDAALATLWIAGIQAVIWGLIPISFMYGKKVLTWSKAGWLAIYGTGMLLFVHTLLRPGLGLFGNAADASLFSVTLLFLSFGAFSLLFWAYFRFRRPRRPKLEIVDAGGERTLVS